MAIARNSVGTGTNNSSSFNVTVAGSIVVAYIVYSDDKTLTAATLAAVGGTLLQVANDSNSGYKIHAVSFVGTFSGSQAVTFTWNSGTPALVRSKFLGYDGSGSVDVSAQNSGTGNTMSASVTAANCWVIGYVGCNTGRSGQPQAGTNNDGYAVAAGTSNGLINQCIGDSTTTVATGSQTLNTATTDDGTDLPKILVAIAPSAVTGPANLKSLSGNVKANIKSISGNLIANVKSLSGNS